MSEEILTTCARKRHAGDIVYELNKYWDIQPESDSVYTFSVVSIRNYYAVAINNRPERVLLETFVFLTEGIAHVLEQTLFFKITDILTTVKRKWFLYKNKKEN